MTLPVWVNGFLPFADGTIVTAFDASTFGTEHAVAIWTGTPDANGMVSFRIARRMAGRALAVVAVGGRAQYLRDEVPVTHLGAFHTVSLRLDRVMHGAAEDLRAPTDWPATSQRRIQDIHRHARYRNYLLALVFAIATVLSVFVGTVIDGLGGIFAGASLTIISLVLGSYATGFLRGF